MDLEKFFDRLNHDKPMSLVKRRTGDDRVLKLINSYLKAGALMGDVWAPASEGTPLSPLVANRLLDELDKELQRGGHRFEKSAVGRPWERVFLGFSFTRRGREKRRKGSDEAIRQFKYRIRKITRRTRGRSMGTVIEALAVYLWGWKGYYGFAQVRSPIQDLEKWVCRKRRCYYLKQGGLFGLPPIAQARGEL